MSNVRRPSATQMDNQPPNGRRLSTSKVDSQGQSSRRSSTTLVDDLPPNARKVSGTIECFESLVNHRRPSSAAMENLASNLRRLSETPSELSNLNLRRTSATPVGLEKDIEDVRRRLHHTPLGGHMDLHEVLAEARKELHHIEPVQKDEIISVEEETVTIQETIEETEMEEKNSEETEKKMEVEEVIPEDVEGENNEGEKKTETLHTENITDDMKTDVIHAKIDDEKETGKTGETSESATSEQVTTTSTSEPRMPVSEEIFNALFRAIDERQDEFVARLAEAVAIPSVSAEALRRPFVVEMSHWAKKELEKLGVECELVDAGTQEHETGTLALPPLVFGRLGADKSKKTLLVYGHLDVQPAAKEDGWNTDPFQLTEIDGKLFGRGSTDDKGPVIAWVNAIETFQRLGIDIPVNIKFVLEGMEESGSVGLEEALKKRQADFLSDVDYVCISDNYWLGKNKPCLTYGLRGICYYFVEVSCAKQDLHSGTFGGSVHEAMADLVWMLAQLTDVKGNIQIPGLMDLVEPYDPEEKQIYEKIDFDKDDYANDIEAHGLTRATKEEVLMNRWRYPSLSIHGVEGAFSQAGAKTVIPAKVLGKFSIRIVPKMTPAETDRIVVEHLNKLWAQRGSPNHFKPIAYHSGNAWVTDYRHPHFQAGVRAMKRVFGVEPDYTREGGSIPVTLAFQELTGKNVMLLPIGSCDDMAHSQNEKLNRVNYINGAKTLAAYLLELAEN